MDTNQLDVASLVGAESFCICGKFLCEKSISVDGVDALTGTPQELHRVLHRALKTRNCAKLYQILKSGTSFCSNDGRSCLYYIIIQDWSLDFLNTALQLQPSAVNCRGPCGKTLPMLCYSVEQLQTLLLYQPDMNATNNEGDNILHHVVKHRVPASVRYAASYFYKMYTARTRIMMGNRQDLIFDERLSFLKAVLGSGVDINALDGNGKTALSIILESYKPGYICTQIHSKSHFNQTDYHNDLFCLTENTFVSKVVTMLLEAGATVPEADEYGRTALMLAIQSPYNEDTVKLLLERGADATATDQAGHNAMYYLLSSFAQHSIIESHLFHHCVYRCAAVDRLASLLLDSGCAMQGTDLVMFAPLGYGYLYRVVVYLMAQRSSTLYERDFPLKAACKNDPADLSFLSVFLELRSNNDITHSEFQAFKWQDLDILKLEMANGLDVLCGGYGRSSPRCCSRPWKKKLDLPYSIQCTKELQCLCYGVHPGKDLPFELAREHFTTLEGIQRLLLPFWPSPPMALLIFCYPDADFTNVTSVALYKRLIDFLYQVGGPLSPGSDLLVAARKRLQTAAEDSPGSQQILQHFNQMHAAIPSLQQLCRNAVRASLTKTDHQGLDLSSLPLPDEMKEYVNFKTSKISKFPVSNAVFSRF